MSRKHSKFNFQYLTSEEKSKLKQRIDSSVSNYLKRRRRFRMGMVATAAIVILMVSITVINKNSSSPSEMEIMVKSLDDKSVSDDVQLVLSSEQSIEISEENASISYSKAGEEVKIGGSTSYKQHSGQNSKLVYNTLIVPYGKRSDLTLSDGTKIWLNSGSKLIFPSAFKTNERSVFLEGEAIFEVAHNPEKPFLVNSKNHQIEVLGTVFNVSTYKNDDVITTVLESGSIKINYQDGRILKTNESQLLRPNQKASFDKQSGEIKTYNVEIEPYFSWRDGIFIFKNDKLESIMKKISRYYNVEIEISNKDLANETFSGYLDVKDDIDNVMKTLKETSDFNYEFSKEQKIKIK